MRYVSIRHFGRSIFAASLVVIADSVMPKALWAQQSPKQASEPVPATTTKPSLEFDIANLNPAFKFTPEQLTRALQEGKDMAKRGKSDQDLMNKWKRGTKITRGKKDTVHGFVWCYGIDANTIAREGLRAATLYEKPNIPDIGFTQGGYSKQLIFEVSLTSQPKVGETKESIIRRTLYGIADLPPTDPNYAEKFRQDTAVLANADAGEIKIVKFVLSDDKDNYLEAISKESHDESGTIELSGIRRETATIQEHSNANISGTTSGVGSLASVNASASGTSTFTLTQYVPYSQKNPYYQARYIVIFPLFDENGKPRIKPDAKEITLHIITETGEQTASYKLQQANN